MSDKATLRARMRALRKSAADANADAARRAAAHLAAAPLRGVLEGGGEGARTVALYWPMGSEMDTRPLAEALEAMSHDLALPVVEARAEPMVFRRWRLGDPLELDMAGCPAPLPLAAEVVPDIIMVPLLAFDARGYRLGQGGGYYDRTLAHLRAVRQPVAIGVAYGAQQVEAVPVEPFDQRLDGILTEDGYRAF
ncbi:MAG: 5-formyltetrahydrofolate cyclo-ligase [Brevundimonas sp.]|uniref:5-formyltetrahydrofolate cyclo-ligase n=1 Tax=Brevundimonas sp. TaxID=1871086 RepID=UPI00391C4C4B